ncbi:hypothetical protein RIF29_25177 [Crotalaria pallida]|uniref:Uncharacterized protein n=1 Tax=Crotalaria pallida TaxID=3830 RepID=A0AAN9HX87_CROPI
MVTCTNRLRPILENQEVTAYRPKTASKPKNNKKRKATEEVDDEQASKEDEIRALNKEAREALRSLSKK